MPIRFRPPRDVPDLGLTPGQQARFNAWLRTAFTEIAEDMATLGQSDAPTIVAQETIDVAAGSLRRVTPPTGGMTVRVPAPTPGNAGQTVRLMLEAPVGELTVVATPGIGDDGKVFQPTINGAARATFSTSGLVTLTSNGSSDWKSASEFAAESPASVAISNGGGALDAEYLLRSANIQLPNARVADDSTEIDISYSSPGLISWFLKTASVAFSKLADLAGLSVFGRATNSSGVMAAITATAGSQKLVTNPAGTAILWESDLPSVFTDSVTGSVGTYDLPSTFRSGDTLRLTLTGNTTIVGFTIGGSVPAAGTEFNLCLSDQSGGSAPGWTLTIPDAGGGAAQFRTPGQVQGTTPGPSYVMQSEEEGARCAFQEGAWRIISGTAAQAITGDITVASGNGSTRDAQITAGVIVNADVNASAAIAQTKLGATTGFSVKASGASATTSAEPIVTYSASANMSAERVTTSSTSVTVSTSVAGQIEFQRAALTGAIAASANANTTLFSGIRDNGSAETDRTNLNFVSSTSATAVVTDDAGNDELEITFQRAALTGAVSASANANATQFAGIRDNGTLETARGFVNVLSTSTITALGTQDAGNDEIELTWSVNLAATYAWTGDHSIGGSADWIMNSSGDFGVIAAAASIISSSTILIDSVGDMTLQSDGDLVLTGDEVRVRSNGTGGFLTFDGATASTPGLASGEGMYWVEDLGSPATRPRFTDDANTDHGILNQELTRQDFTTSGTSNNVSLNANTTYLRIDTGGAAWTITGLSGGYDGRILHFTTNSNVTGTLTHNSAGSSAGNQILCGGSVDATGNRLSGTLIYDGDDGFWRVVSVNVL